MRVLSPVFPIWLLLALSSSNAFVSPTTGNFQRPSATTTRTTATRLHESNNDPLAFLGGIRDTLSKELGSLLLPKETPAANVVVAEPPKPQLPDVVIDPDYKLAIIFLVGGFLLDLIPYVQLTLGPIVTLLGILFVVQTARIRFCFDAQAFELRTGDDLQQTGENIVVGGANRCAYSSFVNYEFFPKGWIDQPQGPILVYFKETQTPSSK